MSISVQPSTPARPLLVGTLTLAHLRPRAAEPAHAGLRLQEERPGRLIALPLKGDKPRALAPAGQRSTSKAAAAPSLRPVVQEPCPAVAAPRAERPKSEADALMKRFHKRAFELWPLAFPKRDNVSGALEIAPLALASRDAITAALSGSFSEAEIRRCMQAWTTRDAYLSSTIACFEQGRPRIHLDGTASADPVTEEQAKYARAVIAKRARRRAARVAAASS